MAKVLTYGTYDVFHEGHYNLLKNAKSLGDYLIVGVTTKSYDEYRGKLNVRDDLMTRIENVRATGFADMIIVEEYEGQKIHDIKKYDIDIFTLGSDWVGKFDYLNEFCKVVYLPRTQGISSTQIRNQESRFVRLGIVGSGRIAARFLLESKYVSGIEVVSVFNPRLESARLFTEKYEVSHYFDDYVSFCESVDAVYIATPHLTHFEYAKKALMLKKHVLCEKPMVLRQAEARELYEIARQHQIVLMEALKSAYTQSFDRITVLAKSGVIGRVKSIDACFTKLERNTNGREFDPMQAGGSMTELGSYGLLPIIRILGTNFIRQECISYKKSSNGVDLLTEGQLLYQNAIGKFKVALGVKSEGELIVSGTDGYIFVPAPWWKTSYFEIRRENASETEKYFFPFLGDGLRYEITEFCRMIRDALEVNHMWTPEEAITLARIMEKYLAGENVRVIFD